MVPEWEPVSGRRLGVAPAEADRAAIERAAAEHEVQPLRWPHAYPPDSELAMLAATYAKRVGRAVAFSLAAFRQAFAAGRDLGDTDTVLIAAAACEMHPAAMLKAIELRSVADALTEATGRALKAGARTLPAIQVGMSIFEGERCVEEAAQVLA